MNITDQPTQASGSRPSRRTVVKGAAWAVPAIAVASAVPAHAANSADCTPKPGLTSASCKKANEKKYKLVFTVVNAAGCASTQDCTIVVTKLAYSGNGREVWSGNLQGGQELIVCDLDAQANGVTVTATITCPGGAAIQGVYPIKMPQATSNNCPDSVFSSCGNGNTPPTDQAPAAGETQVTADAPAAKTQVTADAPAAKTQVTAAKKTLTVEATPSPTPTPTAAQ